MGADSKDFPDRLGRYEIVERLASGGMGEVFVGRFVGPGGFIKAVAVKRIHPHLAEDETFIHMLHDEANVASAIRHPNIVATIDLGSEGGNHFVVLDYVSGDPLSKMLRDLKKKGVACPDWLVAWIGAEIASALHATHEAKNLQGESLEIIHRDVSLSNVLLSDAGHPMLFDFGVAKAKQRLVQTSAGELKGKLPYMAPETFRGTAVDRTVDVFSLGVMLYELATGISPFARDSDLETIMALQSAVVEPPSFVKPLTIHPSLDGIIMRTMARDRADRFSTAQMVEHELRAWARTRSALHDAASAAEWITQNFPDRTSQRRALLARIASGSGVESARMGGSPASGPRTSPRGAATPVPHSRSSPSYDKTRAIVGATPVPSSGQTPPPQQSESRPSFSQPSSPIVTYGATPVSYGQTPPPLASPATDPRARTDASIPGVAQSNTQTTQPSYLATPPARPTSGVFVLLGVVTTFAVCAVIAIVILVSRSKPESQETTAAAAITTATVPPAPPPPPPSASIATSASSSPKAVDKQQTTTRVATPPPPPPTKKGGPLVRSYD